MASCIAADEAKLAIWRAQVAEVRSSLAQRQATGQARVSAIMQLIEQTAMIENMLAASMSPSMAAALDWSRGMPCRSIAQYGSGSMGEIFMNGSAYGMERMLWLVYTNRNCGLSKKTKNED